MTLVGYARVSSSSQSLELQKQQLAESGCEKVFSEKMSGLRNRPHRAPRVLRMGQRG